MSDHTHRETQAAALMAATATKKNPPRNGEGDRRAEPGGGGGPGLHPNGEAGPLRPGCARPLPRSGKDLGRNKPDVLVSPIKLVKRARKLRKEMSLPEVLLWVQLQKRPGGHKFRKQFPQAGLAIDFACVAARLAIEVDGEAHNRGDQPDFDQQRDAVLRERGFTVLRFPAREVFKNMEGVLSSIVAHCDAVGPLHQSASRRGPPPRAGEDFSADPPRNGEVAARSADGGGPEGRGELAASPADLRLGPLHHQPPAGGPPPRSGEDF